MKTIVLLFLINISCIAQQDSIKRIFENDAIQEIYPEKNIQIVGGLDSLQSKLQYPIEAVQHGIEGRVFVQVTIDSSGIPLNPRILKSLGYGCDEEAIRLVLSSKYLPAVVRGKNVKSQISIPVKFKLPNNE